MGESRVCDLGGFGVVGTDWCLGWKESRVCDMGFWCGWGGKGKIVFVGGESWIGCRLITTFSNPPPDRASDLVSPFLLRRSQRQRPHYSEKLILRGVELHFDRSSTLTGINIGKFPEKSAKKSIFADISAITLPFQCSL